jgi:hypothetical protein
MMTNTHYNDAQLDPILRKDMCFCSQECPDAAESRVSEAIALIRQAIAIAEKKLAPSFN